MGVNFFRQTIAKEEFCWVFPHPRLMSKVLDHLDDQGARGVLLLICVPSLVAYSRVFAAGKTARFVKAYEKVAGSFIIGRARQRVYLVQFDFNIVDAFDMC